MQGVDDKDDVARTTARPTKRHRWDDADVELPPGGGSGGGGGASSSMAGVTSSSSTTHGLGGLPATPSMATPTATRWSSATPRQYGGAGGETPRMMAERGTWGGLASTGSATPYATDTVTTPRFGAGYGAGGSTPAMLAAAAQAVSAATPSFGGGAGGATPSSLSAAGGGGGMFATPLMSAGGAGGAAAAALRMTPGATPLFTGATPSAQSMFGMTPNYQFEGTTPVQSHFASSAEAQSAATAAIEAHARRLEKEWRLKNKQLTSEYLDAVLPGEFFDIVDVPAEYNPLPPEEPNFYELALKSLDAFAFAAATPDGGDDGNKDGNTDNNTAAAAGGTTYDIPDSLGEGMPAMRPEDARVFVELLRFHKVDVVPDEHLPSYLLMRSLFKLKNGDTAQRRSGMRFLLDKARVFGSHFIFQRIFRIWSGNVLDMQQKHYFVDLVKALIARMQREVRGSTREVVHMMQPLLSAQEALTREDGKQVLQLLTRVVGFAAVFDAIREDFAHEESVVRRHTAKVAAIACYAAGLEVALPALRDMSHSPLTFARQTVARALGELAALAGHAMTAALPDVVPLLERLLRDEKRVRREVGGAIAAIAEATAPYGIEELAPLVDLVCEECTRGMGNTSGPFLQAFGALVPLMSAYDAQARTAAMMPTLVNQFSTPEDEFRRVLLSVVRKCVLAPGVSRQFVAEVVLTPFFDGFWRLRRVAADRRTAQLLIRTTVAMASKLGSVDVLHRLAPEMKDESEAYQRMVLDAVRQVVHAAGTDAVPDSLVAFLLDGAVAAVRQDEHGTGRAVVDTLATLCTSLGARLRPYLKQLFDLIKRRRESAEAAMRAQAADLAARIAAAVARADGGVFLQDLGRSLYERLEESDPAALAANVRATRAILAALGARKYLPSVRELLKKLTFVIRNHASDVQQSTIALIEDIATHYDADVDAIHLHELATKGLFELLDADRRQTRRACARTFGVIARTIRPFAIVLELVDNFRQDKRKIRNCTAVALAAIARACGPFTVVPYLLNEYTISAGEQVAVIVQHAVLKAIRYMFEFIGAAGRDYAFAFVPLLSRALTETSVQMRRMAVEASRALVAAVAGDTCCCAADLRDATLHLLNLVHPNTVELMSRNEVQVGEERLKLVTAVVSFYEAARLVLGSGVMLQYLLAGMCHPARKVRDVYRRTYNMLYLASPESMVPYYPRVDDEGDGQRLRRYELEVVV